VPLGEEDEEVAEGGGEEGRELAFGEEFWDGVVSARGGREVRKDWNTEERGLEGVNAALESGQVFH